MHGCQGAGPARPVRHLEELLRFHLRGKCGPGCSPSHLDFEGQVAHEHGAPRLVQHVRAPAADPLAALRRPVHAHMPPLELRTPPAALLRGPPLLQTLHAANSSDEVTAIIMSTSENGIAH